MVPACLWGLAAYADVVAPSTTSHRVLAAMPRTTTTIAEEEALDQQQPVSSNRRNNNKDNSTVATSTSHHRSHSLPNQIWDIVSSMVNGPSNNQNAVPSASAAAAGACRSYLAPSTLPGAGLGMFAGRDFAEGDHVTTGDAVVPLLDVDWNSYGKNKNNFLWGT
jgi:hypothetical protein